MKLDGDGFPPVQEGYTRIFTDHTGRWYEDFSPEQMEEIRSDPLLKIWREEATKMIDAEIIAKLMELHATDQTESK